MSLPRVDDRKLPFPIRSAEAQKFWASRHICNRAKAIISFSRNREEAMRLMRRYLPAGKTYHFRQRAWYAWQMFVADPEMKKIPFTPLGVDWWDCLPKAIQPKQGRWAVWEDTKDWKDDEDWVEWIPDPNP